jgi:hypothetical protein
MMVTIEFFRIRLNMPQKSDGLRILDEDRHEVFFWTPRTDDS